MFNMHSTFQLSISFVMERRILISPNKAVISSYNCAIVVFLYLTYVAFFGYIKVNTFT